MAAPKRNIGREILEGRRELKRGEHGRVTTVPSVATIREGEWPEGWVGRMCRSLEVHPLSGWLG